MQDPARTHQKTALPTPSVILSRLHRSQPSVIDTTPDPGAERERAPGHRLREIHATDPDRSRAASREDRGTPEVAYRAVLRCTAADLDH